MKSLKILKYFINFLNEKVKIRYFRIEFLAITLHNERSSVCKMWVKRKIYNIPLNRSIKSVTKYISFVLHFPNKTIHFLSKLFYYSTEISTISTQIENENPPQKLTKYK